MNDTTIMNIIKLSFQVADALKRQYCEGCDKINLLGWSTGGLAAYTAAYLTDYKSKINKIVLIAPGIAPNILVGEGPFSWPPLRISKQSLTSAKLPQEQDPHKDPIQPDSPLKAPLFAMNLTFSAWLARDWKLNGDIQGFVLLSDPTQDNYVDTLKTIEVLDENAPNFSYKIYSGARHEIDNERTRISEPAINDICEFFQAGENNHLGHRNLSKLQIVN